MSEEELWDKAEELAEAALCNVKCLCPKWKEQGMCCECDCFLGLREYYKEQLEEEGEKR